ncbi:hypothetical protein [Cohnella silvisoli]|uniref:Alpha/beta hydrolase n=1 Tax=Cohnella silvisoli TaxID=2873699 RepID=A0ABV1KUB0_9BACL|nr:hypothetical protein [Cohnella silvisoli]MCD9023205.1 hypothetical protein [Cohnella silvisoli]
MQSDLIGKRENGIDLYLMAGFASAPYFMERFRVALQGRLEQGGHSVHSELLFPYGDWSRRAVVQLWEIRSDMRLGLGRLNRSIGGNRALAAIQLHGPTSSGRKTILIGHSGGGVAAVHTAQLLSEQAGGAACFVVMIGSPRCRIPEGLRPSVLAIHAAGRRRGRVAEGKSGDMVSRLGSYGGWIAGTGRGRQFPVWHRDKHAPADTRTVPIIGGHADYFRDSAPYVNPMGQSNLAITLEAIESWLIRWK